MDDAGNFVFVPPVRPLDIDERPHWMHYINCASLRPHNPDEMEEKQTMLQLVKHEREEHREHDMKRVAEMRKEFRDFVERAGRTMDQYTSRKKEAGKDLTTEKVQQLKDESKGLFKLLGEHKARQDEVYEAVYLERQVQIEVERIKVHGLRLQGCAELWKDVHNKKYYKDGERGGPHSPHAYRKLK